MPTARKTITIGQEFDRLTVLRCVGKNKWGKTLWQCQCSCGNLTEATSGQLNNHMKKSCGCIVSENATARNRASVGTVGKNRVMDIEDGQRFKRLTVLAFAGKNRFGALVWDCICDCGNPMLSVCGSALRNKKARSCGCLRGQHGMWKTTEYAIWCAIKQRCYLPSYESFHRYGGRGITMVKEWRDDFMAFFAYVGLRPSLDHTIDRINNDGNYEPSNVRWATRREQATNRSTNVILTLNDRTMCATEWSRELNVRASTLIFRHRRGWSDERVLTTPIRHQSPALTSPSKAQFFRHSLLGEKISD